MAENKKSFLLYVDLIHTLKQLPDDKAGQLFKHILSYVNDENPVTDDMILNIAFEPIKQQLKRDLKKYESICDRNKNNGLKGGRPKTEHNPTEPKKPSGLITNPDEPKKADNDTDTDNDNGIDKRKEKFKTTVFYTIESERKQYTNHIEINKFIEYWTEHGIKDKKMRFEKEKTFGIVRRLDTWFSNYEKFNFKGNRQQQGEQIDLTKMKF
jgi:hypothetical protein